MNLYMYIQQKDGALAKWRPTGRLEDKREEKGERDSSDDE